MRKKHKKVGRPVGRPKKETITNLEYLKGYKDGFNAGMTIAGA